MVNFVMHLLWGARIMHTWYGRKMGCADHTLYYSIRYLARVEVVHFAITMLSRMVLTRVILQTIHALWNGVVLVLFSWIYCTSL